ncbi:type I restriction-modification system restriction endonuclease DNA specificity subunit HsdS [Yeosuana aromativorans]|uniref:Type I restriction-modification system restriction endonuclease DNA specificity subunit HsdS n=1 Tax=Yeosuana aromativorans TaxID=288019 RepID=A0A8J3BS47_9FLAO|nr:restriction endonuclease subunit S [Yeosuana aromativorans]GGK34466.1 type I restriction-modification system restriction endonuclease DNA specificity subunit HsdS [Yeosuana aromativorans]
MKTVTVKHSWFSESDLRLDASFHLSDGVNTKRIIEKHCPYPTTTLRDEANELFKGNIHKRVYIGSAEYGNMFFTASDMFKSDVDSGRYISKKYSPYLEELELKKDWILVTRSGTLGKVVYVTEDYDGKIGTDDLVRIKPAENQIKRGYLYAYLSSKYGYGLLTQSGYGGVVKHIEPHHVENIKVPILPDPEQDKIHKLILDAATLRVESNKIMKEVQNDLRKKCGLEQLSLEDYEYYGYHSPKRTARAFGVKKTNKLSISLKAFNHSKSLNQIREKLMMNVNTISLKEAIDNKGIYHSSAFKRVEVEKGVELLSQKDIFKYKIQGKRISRMYPKKKDYAIRNEILISGVGSMGEGDAFCKVILVKDSVEGKVLAGEFLRMNAKKIPYGYLFSWLNSEYVFRFLRSYGTGTTLIRPIEVFIEEIPVPIFDDDFMKSIHKRTNLALDKFELSRKKDTEAINLIEKEIEQWQES